MQSDSAISAEQRWDKDRDCIETYRNWRGSPSRAPTPLSPTELSPWRRPMAADPPVAHAHHRAGPFGQPRVALREAAAVVVRGLDDVCVGKERGRGALGRRIRCALDEAPIVAGQSCDWRGPCSCLLSLPRCTRDGACRPSTWMRAAKKGTLSTQRVRSLSHCPSRKAPTGRPPTAWKRACNSRSCAASSASSSSPPLGSTEGVGRGTEKGVILY